METGMKLGSFALAVILLASAATMVLFPVTTITTIAAWFGLGFVAGRLNPQDRRQAIFQLLLVLALAAGNFLVSDNPRSWGTVALMLGLALGWALERPKRSEAEPSGA